MTTAIDSAKSTQYIEQLWGDTVVPTLTEYIKIPNKSPMFDKDWRQNGYMADAVKLVAAWCRDHLPPGAELEVVQLGERTPLIFIDVPASGDAAGDDVVLLYGHLDKQPEMVGWDDGLGPWKPVLKGERLYGRGGADDGYAAFASLSALGVMTEQNTPRARCVILIEACEESGSYDLPHYIDHLAPRIGTPSLVVCLDSGCGNYDQLWCTTSLRGVVTGNLRAQLIREGVHSGDASGIVASSFRVLRHVLSRLEDPATGAIKPEWLHVEIPKDRAQQARVVAEVLGSKVWDHFPWHDGVTPITDDLTELVLNRSWRPALSVTGVAGMPALADAGNVMRPETAVKLSLRLPPTLDSSPASKKLRELLESDPPYGAKVSWSGTEGASGWNAPPVAPWLESALDAASHAYFGKPAVYMGEGGSIPFMGMLGDKFPEAQFVITGVLGPQSNAHGPNEFLDLPTAKRISGAVANVLADHYTRAR